MDREILDWTTFGTASRELAQTVVDTDYRPDIVLSIARGGLLLGGSLAYALGVKSCYLVNVEYYTGVDERLDAPVVLPPALDLEAAQDARILIADDVADTGHTLKLVQDLCTARVAQVRTAVLYEKSRSVVQCEYVWHRTDKWVVFPWSGQPSLLPEGSQRNTSATP